ncbi:hypothetical protein BO86DRAFT_347941 [Aspergillus japonicus CBS 114.51]|uniref:Uncharacterized protein n=2 Tax=Aspergillus TaxID=5052 RepID=A0A2V5H078_ASPV1|nr:hypothetical protein BO86DRAFT_347941 [Aspergillus japonicus CBS 114.51]PYI15112.1 hypothetical protein BO99DRAFT_368887 [Aspergillus violaceofuscus CBS 115571]RAH77160.1 hypothetical protein BO86DRAFT_347941 [Aspergillus japonicus CBS 114.51]
MKFQATLPLAVLLSAASVTSSGTNNVWDIVATLIQAPSGDGYLHLDDDGVLISLSGSGDVLAYRQLDPKQINQYINRFPSPAREHLLGVFKGVDGRDVIDIAQLAHFDLKALLPEPDEASLPVASSSSTLNHLAERACHNYACSGPVLCYSYTCSVCAKADHLHWGLCY